MPLGIQQRPRRSLERLWGTAGRPPSSLENPSGIPSESLGVRSDSPRVPGGGPGRPWRVPQVTPEILRSVSRGRYGIDLESIQDRSNVRHACFEKSMGFSPLEPRWTPRVNSAYGSAAQAGRLLNKLIPVLPRELERVGVL